MRGDSALGNGARRDNRGNRPAVNLGGRGPVSLVTIFFGQPREQVRALPYAVLSLSNVRGLP